MTKDSHRRHSPEHQLLLLLAQPSVDAKARAVIIRLLRERLDWDYVLAVADEHSLTPLVDYHMRTFQPRLVPDLVQSRLSEAAQRNTRCNLALAGELTRVIRSLEESGVLAIPFKGPTLALAAYGDLGLRQFADLDILIHARDFEAAQQTLAKCGYSPATPVDRERERALLRFDNARGFENDREVFLDLHWRFAPAYFGLKVESDDMWQRLQPVSVGGHTLQTLATEDLLVALCCHGFTHTWERLVWISDIAGLILKQEKINWDEVTQRARQRGIQNIVSLGLLLANEILGAEVPPEMLDSVRQDKVIRDYSDKLQSNLFGARPVMGLVEAARLRERRRDKVRSFLKLVATPRSYDCMFAGVPGSLGFLYYFVRPLRMVRDYGPRLLKTSSARD